MIHNLRQPLHLQIGEAVRSDDPADLLRCPVICKQLLPFRNVSAEITGMEKRRRADTHVNLFRACLAKHPHDPVTRGAPHDRIIDHHHTFVLHRRAQGIQLDPDRRLTALLPRPDKGSADISVLDKPLAVRNSALHAVTQRRRAP